MNPDSSDDEKQKWLSETMERGQRAAEERAEIARKEARLAVIIDITVFAVLVILAVVIFFI